MASAPRGRCNSRGKGWKRLLLERFCFKGSQTWARSRTAHPSMLPFTVTKPVTSLQFSKEVDPCDVEHARNLRRCGGHFAIFSFPLTILFLLSFSRLPRGVSENEKVLRIL